MGLLGRFNYWGAAFGIMGILANSTSPHSVADYMKLASQVALAVDPNLGSDKTYQMVQQGLANIDAATAAMGPGEVGRPVGFKNAGQQLYLHFIVDTK